MSQWLAIALIVIIALQIMVILTLLHLGSVIQPLSRGPMESTRQTLDALQLTGMGEDQAKALMRELVVAAARKSGSWQP